MARGRLLEARGLRAARGPDGAGDAMGETGMAAGTAAGTATGTAAGTAFGTGGMLGLAALGGPAIWAILALSVAGLAIVLWKLWRMARAGHWAREGAEAAAGLWAGGDRASALARAEAARGPRAALAEAGMAALLSGPAEDAEPRAREAMALVARRAVAEAEAGLRGLDLIATVAPLVGLLGTVLGMIAAFQALEATGGAASPSDLAGGIWQALLTTAAGMAVAIPASMALSAFEGSAESLAGDLEDIAARILLASPRRRSALAEAAE